MAGDLRSGAKLAPGFDDAVRVYEVVAAILFLDDNRFPT